MEQTYFIDYLFVSRILKVLQLYKDGLINGWLHYEESGHFLQAFYWRSSRSTEKQGQLTEWLALIELSHALSINLNPHFSLFYDEKTISYFSLIKDILILMAAHPHHLRTQLLQLAIR